jgi:VanZ family protein
MVAAVLPSLTRLLSLAKFWWGLFVAWGIGVTLLSSLSALPVPPVQTRWLEIDKLVHAAAYCVGALFLTPAVHLQSGWGRARTGWVALFCMIAYGVADEIHQVFVPNRTGMDAGDLVANAVGAALGVALILILYVGIQARQGGPADRRTAS